MREYEDKDPLHYEEILTSAGWKVFQRDQGNYFAAHGITGRIIEIFTDHEDHADRTEDENQNWDRSWACYMFFEAIGEITTERDIKRKQRQREQEEYLL